MHLNILRHFLYSPLRNDWLIQFRISQFFLLSFYFRTGADTVLITLFIMYATCEAIIHWYLQSVPLKIILNTIFKRFPRLAYNRRTVL